MDVLTKADLNPTGSIVEPGNTYTPPHGAEDLYIRGGDSFVRLVSQAFRDDEADPTEPLVLPRVSLPKHSRHLVIQNVFNVSLYNADHATLHGCVLSDCGVETTSEDDTRDDRRHGFNLYAHGEVDLIDACYFGYSFGGSGWSWKGYGAGNVLRNTLIRDAVCDGRVLIGGTKLSTEGVRIERGVYGGGLRLGYTADEDGEIVIDGAVIFNRLHLRREWRKVAVRNCIIIDDDPTAVRTSGKHLFSSAGGRPEIDFDGNTYYVLADKEPFGGQTFDEWRAETGQDASSTFVQGLPAEPIIRFAPLVGHPTRRAIVTIINCGKLPIVSVDLSSLNLIAGKHYILRQMRDFWRDVRSFTYTGDPVDVQMEGTIAPIQGWVGVPPAFMPGNRFPEYGSFMVEESSEGGEDMPDDVRELVEKLDSLSMTIEQAQELLDLVAVLNPDRDWESFRTRSALLAERDKRQKEVRNAEELLRSRQAALREVDGAIEQARRQIS